MFQRTFIACVLLLSLPAVSKAWWNEQWPYRKQMSLNAAGAELQRPVSGIPVLVRLHTGNFAYFLDVAQGAKDLRFIAGDDQTPLEYYVDKFDPINELALVWVKVPTLEPGPDPRKFWMYYGNSTAADGANASGIFDVHQVLALSFGAMQKGLRDLSAYGNHPAASAAAATPTSIIGEGARLNGSGGITIAAHPSLAVAGGAGWTFSTWIRIDAPQSDAYVLHRRDGESALILGMDGVNPYARVEDAGVAVETPRAASLTPGTWHHLALVVGNGRLAVYLDGSQAASVEAPHVAFSGPLTIGAPGVQAVQSSEPLPAAESNPERRAQAGSEAMNAAADSEAMPGDDPEAGPRNVLVGDLDEVRIANVARSSAWLAIMFRNQSPDSTLVVYGEDESEEGGGGGSSHIGIILQKLTVDGWVVIAVLAVMSAISWIVMLVKGVVVSRTRKSNRSFLDEFGRLGVSDMGTLDENDGREASSDSSSGKGKHFRASTIYRIYRGGMREIRHRVGAAAGAAAAGLTPQAVAAVRATMDAMLVRETQKLNGQMVLLTIAISGGPFIGLLGTVVGVMITFAAIAQTGDVNINNIAPGMAAALLATVAGLAVAIPALFGYNYLGSRIKEITSDMQVFVDEFISKVAEHHAP